MVRIYIYIYIYIYTHPGKIPGRRERLPTLAFWPGEFHGLYSPWGHKNVGHDWATWVTGVVSEIWELRLRESWVGDGRLYLYDSQALPCINKSLLTILLQNGQGILSITQTALFIQYCGWRCCRICKQINLVGENDASTMLEDIDHCGTL